MKRLSAILFLLILVFNFYGYRLMLSYMEKNGTAVLERKLDQNQYSDEELISIKTKLNLPYYTSSPQFERTYGSVTFGGVVYEYVKQRVYNDTLELLCLPNAVKTKLQNVNNELTKAAADGQASWPQKKSTTLKISLPDFCQALAQYTTFVPVVKKIYRQENNSSTLPAYLNRQERPPQASVFLS